MFMRKTVLACAAAAIALGAAATAHASSYRQGNCGEFTIAAIPDTQNYVDFRAQQWSGFALDATEQFYGQMKWIKANAVSNGGDVVFATHLGDVWQHYSAWMDEGHTARGFGWLPNAGSTVAQSPKVTTRGFEIPAAAMAMDIIDGALPFSIVPGNHDYDALWTSPQDPPRPEDNYLGTRHVGGLSGYLSVFSDQSHLFKGKPWYVASNDNGADSAQVFTAGQCKFLHIGLQFQAPDASLEWASRIIAQNPGLPTIITTHHFLGRNGKRFEYASPIAARDPIDNDAEMIWNDFISQHDQIFMVLSGHVSGQGYSSATNRAGNPVHQIMSDYQSRGQSAIDAGVGYRALGDGWMRLMKFNLDGDRPQVHVRTYSTHYNTYSTDLTTYAEWYKARDGQRNLTDEEFHKRDDFVITLDDFKTRF